MPGRVAPEDIAEVRFGDPVGRQVEDRWSVARDLQQRAQVAELEAAVDQHGPLVELAEGDREVEGDRRLADAALRREDGHHPRRSRSPAGLLELLAHRVDPGHEIEAGERHREDAVDACLGIGSIGFCGHGQDDDRDAEPRPRGSARPAWGP